MEGSIPNPHHESLSALVALGTLVTHAKQVRTLYKNMAGRNNSSVIRTKNFHYPFQCTYGRRSTVSTSYSHTGNYFASEDAYGNFTFKMALYRNQSFSTSFESREYPISIELDEPLYVGHSVTSSTADLVVFAETFRATTTGNPNSLPHYDFIRDGCEVDDTMTYNYTLNRVQRFTIHSFRFIANHTVIYLPCFLMVCHKNASDSRCHRGCAQPMRARRHIEASMRDFEAGLRDSDSGMREKVRRDVLDGSMLYELTPGPMKRRSIGGTGEEVGKKASNKEQGLNNILCSKTSLLFFFFVFLPFFSFVFYTVQSICGLW
ncbi:ZP domain-containing protein [Nematostella vectensis]|uniref:ZP domain-containing protein n=1 Tax=Nematostella vectensis TaxID=45351 RepID=UPI00138FABC0|nr:ZP domain-containing protein [Nematostella vectensis]